MCVVPQYLILLPLYAVSFTFSWVRFAFILLQSFLHICLMCRIGTVLPLAPVSILSLIVAFLKPVAFCGFTGRVMVASFLSAFSLQMSQMILHRRIDFHPSLVDFVDFSFGRQFSSGLSFCMTHRLSCMPDSFWVCGFCRSISIFISLILLILWHLHRCFRPLFR